jgi:hypothetical protein
VLCVSAVAGIDVLEVDGWHDLGVATGSAVSHYSQFEWAQCAAAMMRATNDALDLEFPHKPSPMPGPPGAASVGAGGSRASSGAIVRSPSTPLVPGPGSAASVAAEEPGVSTPVAEGAASAPMAVDGGDSVSTRPFSLFEHADTLVRSRCPRLRLQGRSGHALPHAAAHLATTLLTLRDLMVEGLW